MNLIRFRRKNVSSSPSEKIFLVTQSMWGDILQRLFQEQAGHAQPWLCHTGQSLRHLLSKLLQRKPVKQRHAQFQRGMWPCFSSQMQEWVARIAVMTLMIYHVQDGFEVVSMKQETWTGRKKEWKIINRTISRVILYIIYVSAQHTKCNVWKSYFIYIYYNSSFIAHVTRVYNDCFAFK